MIAPRNPTDAGPAFRRYRLAVYANGHPQILAKIVGTIALYGLLPRELNARVAFGALICTVDLDMDQLLSERLTERLRATVAVHEVVLDVCRHEGASVVSGGSDGWSTVDDTAEPAVTAVEGSATFPRSSVT